MVNLFHAAADPGAEPVDLGILAQYGVLGCFAIVLLLFARISYRREVERADRLEAEVVRLNNLIIDRAIPALTAAANAAEDATKLMRDLQREREMTMLRGSPARSRPRQGDDR